MSFSSVFALSLFSFLDLLQHRPLLPHAALLLLSFFLLLTSIYFLLLLSLYLSPLLRILSGTSPSTCRSFCLLPPLPLEFSFSLVFCLIVCVFSSHAPWKVAVDVFELLSTTTVSCPFIVPLILVCYCVLLTTHSLPFFSAFYAHFTTAHSRCDEFFASHFSI